MAEPVLVADKLSRRFGGLTANDNVDLRLVRGELHALVGPNGAGKSTFINMLSGDMAPSGGQVRFKGRDITHLDAPARSRIGIGRSYQRTNIFARFTVLENCRLAAGSRRQQPWRWLADAYAMSEPLERAQAAIEKAHLAGRESAIAGTLSHGEQRQLEIALVLAADAEVLLLDEPLAGMGAEESAQMVELLRGLRAGHAILLVEHDMDAVFAVADLITVLVNGQVLASGLPDAIRANADVQQAYLGQDDSHG